MKKIQLENNEGWFDFDRCSDDFDICVEIDEWHSRRYDVFRTKNGNFITRGNGHRGKVYFRKSTPEEIGLWDIRSLSKYTFPPEDEQ